MNVVKAVWLATIAALLMAGPGGCASVMQSQGGETTILLTRHGDRDLLSDQLNETGLQRAEALVTAIGELKIDAIYRTDLERNAQTARPLEQYLGLTSHVVSAKPNMDEITPDILERHPGETVIWIGNKHNLQRIYAILGGEGDAPTRYGDLYIVTLKEQGAPEVIKKRYGP